VIGGLGISLVSFQILAQLAPSEDINTHGSLVALGNLRLLVEFINGAVLIGVQDAETGSFGHGNFDDSDGAGSVLFFMSCQHLGIVHLIDVVTGKNHDIFGVIPVDKTDILIDSVCSALIPVGLLASLIRR